MPPIDFGSAVQHALKAANDPDSHTELDASTFHPSQMAMCRRQAFLSKLGLKDMTDAFGYFQPGTLIHEFLEEQLRDAYPDHWFEYPVHHQTGGITIVGHTDCYDHQRDIVYDVKTRGGWHRFDPPKDRHLDQVHAYMAALGAEKAQIVYISKKISRRSAPGRPGMATPTGSSSSSTTTAGTTSSSEPRTSSRPSSATASPPIRPRSPSRSAAASPANRKR